MKNLDNILSNAAFGSKEILSQGVKLFLKEQDPEEVNFVEHPNGYSIQVKTDPASIEQAKNFWENHVQSKL